MALSTTRNSVTRVGVPQQVRWHTHDENKWLNQIAEYYLQNKENFLSDGYAEACEPSGYVLTKRKTSALQSRIKRLKAKKKFRVMQLEVEAMRHHLTQMAKDRDTLKDLLQKESHRYRAEGVEAQSRYEQVVKK